MSRAFPHLITMYGKATGGSIGENRQFIPGDDPPVLYQGQADVQEVSDSIRLQSLRAETGDLQTAVDAKIYVPERAEAAFISLAEEGLSIQTPFGLCQVVRVRHLDGEVQVRYL